MTNGRPRTKPNPSSNGTIPAPKGIDWLCVSPKGNASLAQLVGDELKLVYPQDEAAAEPDKTVSPSQSLPAEAVASRAEKHLYKLKELYRSSKEDTLKPNTRTYNTAIRSLASQRSKEAVERAHKLLQEMNRLTQQGERTVRPDIMTCATFLNLLLAVEGVPNKAEIAKGTLELMQLNGIPTSKLKVAGLSKLLRCGVEGRRAKRQWKSKS